MANIKIVLDSETGYSDEHNELLLSILAQGYELLCVVGVDCEMWEEAMDELAVGDGSNSRYITTTSHPEETVEDVIAFASMFQVSKDSDV